MRKTNLSWALIALVALAALYAGTARAQTATEFLEGKFPVAFGMCGVPQSNVKFYCEIFASEDSRKFLVIYDEKSEPFIIKEMLPDGLQKVVWSEGNPA